MQNKNFIQLSNQDRHYFGESFTPDIVSIGMSLSFINRFNGHVGYASVAQHSVLVAQQLPKDLQLSGLLHDAIEAYLGDVASPLKKYLKSQGDNSYAKLEQYYHSVIDEYYGVDTRNPAIKVVDLRMLVTEAKSFGMNSIIEVNDYIPYDFTIERQSVDKSYRDFVNMFYELGGLKDGVL